MDKRTTATWPISPTPVRFVQHFPSNRNIDATQTFDCQRISHHVIIFRLHQHTPTRTHHHTVCNATFAVLAIDGLDCACTSSLIAGANSAMGEMECSVKEGCLDEKAMFCGKGDMNGSIEAGQNGIGLQLSTCIYMDVDLNLLPDDDLFTNSTLGPYDICVSASSQPGNWGFDECSATLGGEYCECTVCQNFGVIFDCTAIGGPLLPLCRTMILEPIDPVDDDFFDIDDAFFGDDGIDDDPFDDDEPASGKGSGKASKSKKGW
jgi:hypothetical protein